MLGDDKFVVYVHTNKKNQKKYVGWTSRSLEERWNYHLSDVKSGSQRYFHNAIRKWGSEDSVWDHSVLEIVRTRQEAKDAEVKWINELKTFAYDSTHNGYNETLGGDGAIGYRHSKESLDLIKEKRSKQIMKPRSLETTRKISEGNRKYFADRPELCLARGRKAAETRARKKREIENG